MGGLLSYYINKLMGKEIPESQKRAYEKATSSERAAAQRQAEAKKYDRGMGGTGADPNSGKGSEKSRRPASPPTRPVVGKKSATDMPPLPTKKPKVPSKPRKAPPVTEGGKVKPAPRVTSAMEAKALASKSSKEKSFLAGTPDNSRTKGHRDARIKELAAKMKRQEEELAGR